MKNGVWFAAALLAGACAQGKTADPEETSRVSDWDSVEIALDRSVCFGFCPSYVVRVSGDGEVSYCGDNFVKAFGEQSRAIDPADVRALFETIEEAGYFDMRDEYRAEVTDLPTYKISVSHDGVTKTLADYGGTMVDMPEGVRSLQDAIDETAGTAAWVGAPDPANRASGETPCEGRL